MNRKKLVTMLLVSVMLTSSYADAAPLPDYIASALKAANSDPEKIGKLASQYIGSADDIVTTAIKTEPKNAQTITTALIRARAEFLIGLMKDGKISLADAITELLEKITSPIVAAVNAVIAAAIDAKETPAAAAAKAEALVNAAADAVYEAVLKMGGSVAQAVAASESIAKAGADAIRANSAVSSVVETLSIVQLSQIKNAPGVSSENPFQLLVLIKTQAPTPPSPSR